MRAPEFEAYLFEAKQRPEFWRLLGGVILIVVLSVTWGLMSIAGLALSVVGSVENPSFGLGRAMAAVQSLAIPDQPGEVVFLLSTFLGILLATFLATAAFHFRGPGTLFGEWSEWRRGFLISFSILVPVYVVLLGIAFSVEEATPNLAPRVWLAWLPLALPMLFIQITAEEVLFRGYLQQQLAARFAARWIWFWIPAVMFSLLHWSPDAGGNLPLILLSTLTFGLVAADLTERTGSLGAAMGLHFGNNMMALFFIVPEGSITGLALYTSPLALGETGINSLAMAMQVPVLLGVWWLTVRALE